MKKMDLSGNEKRGSHRQLRCDRAAPLIDDLTNQLTVINLCCARLSGNDKVSDDRLRQDNQRRISHAIEQANDLAERLKAMCENFSSASRRSNGSAARKPYANLSLVVGGSKRSV